VFLYLLSYFYCQLIRRQLRRLVGAGRRRRRQRETTAEERQKEEHRQRSQRKQNKHDDSDKKRQRNTVWILHFVLIVRHGRRQRQGCGEATERRPEATQRNRTIPTADAPNSDGRHEDNRKHHQAERGRRPRSATQPALLQLTIQPAPPLTIHTPCNRALHNFPSLPSSLHQQPSTISVSSHPVLLFLHALLRLWVCTARHTGG